MGKLNKEAVEAYKNELKNLWFYMQYLNDIDNDIELIEYEMGGVKGVDYSKQTGTHNPEAAESRRLKLIEEYNKLLKKRKEIEDKEKSVCRVLNVMKPEDRNLVIDVIASRRRFRDVCKELNISSTATLANMINEIIDEAIKKAG